MENLNSTVILSGILLYIGNALKTIPSQIWSFIKIRFGISIDCDTRRNDDFFDTIDNWLVSLNKRSLMNHYTIKNTYNGEVDEWIHTYSIGNGVYTFWYEGKLFIVDKSSSETKNPGPGGMIVDYLRVYILGFGAKKIKNELETKMMDLYNNKDKIKVIGYNTKDKFVNKRNFDSVIIKDKQILINFLDNWITKKDFYRLHNIFHTGILLYGPSGTGKSSIIKCIAGYLNMRLFIINLTDTTSHLDDQLSLISKNTIVVFEDIDCIMNIDRSDCNDKEKNEKRAKLQLLLNTLDGITTPDGCIFVATTNYVDHLDEALIRPGRFDLKFEVGYFDKEEAKQMCDLFECDYSILDDLIFPIKPSELQTICISKIMNGNVTINREVQAYE